MSKLYHTSFGIQIQWNFRKNLLIFASGISVKKAVPGKNSGPRILFLYSAESVSPSSGTMSVASAASSSS